MNDKVTLKLDTNETVQLWNAFNQMDGEQKPVKVNGQEAIVRVPYILGVKIRRVIVRNLAFLKTAINLIDEHKQSILSELWPDAPKINQGEIAIKDFPPGIFEKFKAANAEAVKQKEEITLYTIPSDVLEATGNDFPLFVLSTLDEHGLIIDKPDDQTKH